MTLFQLRSLDKHYGHGPARVRVLQDLTLEIEAGEFVAIVGTSGSGKTTLLNILGGLDQEYSGEVLLEGTALQRMPDHELAALRNRRFGFVFQQFHLLDHLSSLENVALPHFFDRGNRAMSDAEARARARELLGRVGLGERAEAMPPALSGGQKQRVAIARALFHEPAVILCDEPTGSLDRKTGLQIMDIFEELNADEALTLIVVTHERHIARMARRIIQLEDGQLLSDEPNEPERPEIRAAGLGLDDDEELDHHARGPVR